MQHKLKLTVEEKINRWLDLCDLTFKLWASSLSRKELRERLRKLREGQLEKVQLTLSKLAKLK